jgi:lysophospholipase L1-like esterase
MNKLHSLLRSRLIAGVFALGASQVFAQASHAPVGIVDEPCAPAAAMPASVRDLLTELFMEPRTLAPDDFAQLMQHEEFAQYNAANRHDATQDWAGLCRFRAANAALLNAGAAPRVVFIGDSITENWSLGDPGFFGDEFVNRGIGGQTTPQMLLRFRADVVALQPAIVHILAGTNDIAGNTGPSTAQDFRNNIMSMVDIAQANGIAVILGSIPPAATFNWQPALDPTPRIRELNTWLRDYAQQRDLGYIEYFTPLAGMNAELRADLGNDGVHPNRDGYVIMRRLVETQLAQKD